MELFWELQRLLFVKGNSWEVKQQLQDPTNGNLAPATRGCHSQMEKRGKHSKFNQNRAPIHKWKGEESSNDNLGAKFNQNPDFPTDGNYC